MYASRYVIQYHMMQLLRRWKFWHRNNNLSKPRSRRFRMGRDPTPQITHEDTQSETLSSQKSTQCGLPTTSSGYRSLEGGFNAQAICISTKKTEQNAPPAGLELYAQVEMAKDSGLRPGLPRYSAGAGRTQRTGQILLERREAVGGAASTARSRANTDSRGEQLELRQGQDGPINELLHGREIAKHLTRAQIRTQEKGNSTWFFQAQ